MMIVCNYLNKIICINVGIFIFNFWVILGIWFIYRLCTGDFCSFMYLLAFARELVRADFKIIAHGLLWCCYIVCFIKIRSVKDVRSSFSGSVDFECKCNKTFNRFKISLTQRLSLENSFLSGHQHHSSSDICFKFDLCSFGFPYFPTYLISRPLFHYLEDAFPMIPRINP